MDPIENQFLIFTRKDLIQKSLRNFLGQSTVFTSPHVQTLDFQLVHILAIHFSHVDGRILLLGMQQESTEDVININLQEPVSFVDGLLELLTDFEGVADSVHVSVDHNGVSITIDDSKLAAFGQLLGAPEDFTTLECGKHGQGTSVESTLGVTQTSVHGVGSQLKRQLLCIPQGKLFRCGAFVFHELLHFTTTTNKGGNQPRQNTLLLF